MIVVYPFYPGDQDLAEKNAKWISELGGCKAHDCLMIADKRCTNNIVDVVGIELGKAFNTLHFQMAYAEIDGWPEGANYFFRLATAWLQNKQWPCFLWLEPDAIPLQKGWLDEIQAEYIRAGRKFMGDRVQVENIPLHMSGVGIYPNPLHQYAGEAYRASDTAWDMAAKDQIVPQAHFTKLIEHAWKHPKFTSKDELRTQIRPECVLFHSSKDGSLIDLLRGRETVTHHAHNVETVGSIPTPAINVGGGGQGPLTAGERDAVVPTIYPVSAITPVPADTNGVTPSAQPTCDIFIRTYPGDYPWLAYCLRAINKFCSGFRKIWIISPQDAPLDMKSLGYEWRQMNDESEDGYLAQQITKLYADVITDYQADYILHVDSDVILTRETRPENFFSGGKLIWYYTAYAQIETPWKPITEKFMGMTVEYEFMRRFPMMVPRWLYPKLREFCHKKHGMIISDYVRNQPLRAFSEFNALGAYAFAYKDHFKDLIQWLDTSDINLPEPLAIQYFSWGGLTPDIEIEIMENLAEESPPARIKKLSNGTWVIEGDTHVSKWVEQEQRLDHDQNTLPFILPLIKEGQTVIDIGAFIGDHTIAYAQAVGLSGKVYAFEPNPVAFQCLKHNTRDLKNVWNVNVGLSDKTEIVPLSGNNGNEAGAYVGSHMKLADVKMERFDDEIPFGADFIKIDAEGYEPKILDGMHNTLDKYHPILVIEVNEVALERQGFKPSDIFWRLESHGYDYKIIQENCKAMDPMYDIICLPKQQLPKEVILEGLPPITSREDLQDYIDQIKAFSDSSPLNKSAVMQKLVYAGLRKPNPKKKKTPDANPFAAPKKKTS